MLSVLRCACVECVLRCVCVECVLRCVSMVGSLTRVCECVLTVLDGCIAQW